MTHALASDNRIDYEISAERRLMLAVINTAILDAAGAYVGTSRPGECDYAQRRALLWLKDGGRDFRSICELAGFDPLDVQTRALEFISSGREIPKINRMSPSSGKNRHKAQADA
ncbi:MAG: hypothetical protein KKA05_10200 [Alphaproteobacteria bacterium]|nr:hypothetical protein [Alphaproteobacteria bacterium]